MIISFIKAIIINALLIGLTKFVLCEFSYLKYFIVDELKGEFDLNELTINIHKILTCFLLCFLLFFEDSFKFCEFLIISMVVPIIYHYYLEYDNIRRKIITEHKLSDKIMMIMGKIPTYCLHKIFNICSLMSLYLIGNPEKSSYMLFTSLIWCTISFHNILMVFSRAKTKAKVNLDYDDDYINNRHVPTSLIELLKLCLIPLIFVTIITDVIAIYKNINIDWRVWVLYMVSMISNILLKMLYLFNYYDVSKGALDRIKKSFILYK